MMQETKSFLPFNKPYIAGKELFYIAQSVTFGNISGDGAFTKKCVQYFQEKMQIKKLLTTPSCTAALEMAAILAEIVPGDEVILPSYTFVSTANAFVLRGAIPKFIDLNPQTLNLDVNLLESTITPRTRAIVPVHYAGVSCEMDDILQIARKHDLLVVEDAAQAVGSTYKGKYCGSIGDLGTYSFHETKNFTCGEGGALCINNVDYFKRAEIIRDKGTNRQQFFRGEVDKYTWVDLGSSYVPSEITAAFLFGQLEQIDHITQLRKSIYDRYQQELSPLAHRGVLTLPYVPKDCVTNYHMFYILTETHQIQTELLGHLKSRGVHAVFHYVPLHSSVMGQKYGYQYGDFPLTENLSSRLIRLPFYCELAISDQQRIIKEVFDFFGVVYS